jgi:hypothetical protein
VENDDYTYRVEAAWDPDGEGDMEPIVSDPISSDTVTVPIGVPARPSGVTVTPGNDGHSMGVSWTNNSAIAEGYIVERQTIGGTWATVATIDDPEQTSYTDETDVHSATAYSYRVKALGDSSLAGAPESEESDEELNVTDYGDGIVYSGSGWSSGEGFDGVTGSWSGPWDEPELGDDTVSVTLSNLPDHYGLEVIFQVLGFNETEPETLTIGGLGEDVAQPFNGDGWLSTFVATADHTEDSVTLTLTGSGFDSPQAGSWNTPTVMVKVLRYRPSAGLPVLTVKKREDEPVPVTALKEDGSPGSVENVEIVRTKNLSAEVEGACIILTGGAKLGEAGLVLQVAGGGQALASTGVQRYTIDIHPQPYAELGVGEYKEFTLTVLDAHGHAVPNDYGNVPIARRRPSLRTASARVSIYPAGNATDFVLRVTALHHGREPRYWRMKRGHGRMKRGHESFAWKMTHVPFLASALVRRAQDWRWSSLWRRAHGDERARRMLSTWPVELPNNWLELVNRPQRAADESAVQRSITRSAPFGSERWTLRMAKELGLQWTLRPRGRPPKEAKRR